MGTRRWRDWVLVLMLCVCPAATVILGAAQARAAAAPSIESEYATSVSDTTATLQAQINPNEAETIYHYEYGPTTSYGASAPVTDADLGSGSTVLATSPLQLRGLTPASTYHYRVVATSSPGGAIDGPDHTFTTQAQPTTPALPDGRAYELVSPVSKGGAEALGIDTAGASNVVAQASENGQAITYGMKFPPDEGAASAPLAGVNLISSRAADGWATQDITPPYAVMPDLTLATTNPFSVFSPDLSLAIMRSTDEANIKSLSTEPVTGVFASYFVRSDSGYRQLLAGTYPEGMSIVFEGASLDLSHVVVASPLVPLAPQSTLAGRSLYEWSNGHFQLVNVLPGGEQTVGTGGGGTLYLGAAGGFNVRHAISNNGSRVIWSVYPTENTNVSLYERDMLTEETVQVGQGGHEEFQTASTDGLKIFSTNQPGGEGAADLYEYDVVGKRMNDLAPGGSVQGVLGASEDGSYVYFVGAGALEDSNGQALRNAEGKEPLAGEDNLYVSHEVDGVWTASFIATLAAGDDADWSATKENVGLAEQTARVSPNGRFVAFMSRASVTGYDNTDVNSGQPDAEVYLYDAGSGRSSCASCDPTGARPVGEESSESLTEPLPMDPVKAWAGQWLSAAIPGWTPASLLDAAYYQSRYLSDEGRLFFDSADALVAQDTNGKEDVYEYEPTGVGDCRQAQGCVALISSGTGGGSSSFVDASASGNDVFFRTQSRLASQDVDDAYDMYDARVCSTSAPCPSTVVSVPPCASSDACKAAPSTQPAVYGAPPSATFSGAGNLVPPAKAPAGKKATRKKTIKCAKGRKLSHGKCVKAKAKRRKVTAKKSSNHRRASR